MTYTVTGAGAGERSPGARVRRRGLLALLGLGLVVACAVPLAAQTHVLVVSGLGGEKRFTDRFREMGVTLTTALTDRLKLPSGNMVWVGEDSTPSGPFYRGAATRAAVEREFAALRGRVKPGEQVVVVLIGHGAGSEAESRISLPGPDVTVLDVQRFLASFAGQRVALVNLTSASGDFLPILAAQGRVVITATKTSFERNESHFGKHFVDALAKDVADTDKDGRISLLEAYRYAARETKRVYDDASKIQTEHAQLDDNGTKQATADPTGRQGQGMLARRFFFDSRAATAAGDVQVAALYQARFDLEVQVDSLRARKATMTADAYDADLERILVALARKSREIRHAEGRP